MLATLGQHLGAAIETLRLASRDRELAIAEERNLLAQELHDSIAQALAFLNLQTQMLRQARNGRDHGETMRILDEIQAGVRESYADVRELLVHFRTRVAEGDLEHGIRTLLARFEHQTGVRTEFEAAGAAVPLAPDDQLQVMHILQEASRTCASTPARRASRCAHARSGLRVHGAGQRPRLRCRRPRATMPPTTSACGSWGSAPRGSAARSACARGRAAAPRSGSTFRRRRGTLGPPRDRSEGRRVTDAARDDPHRRHRRPHALPARHHGALVARSRVRRGGRGRGRIRGHQGRRPAQARRRAARSPHAGPLRHRRDEGDPRRRAGKRTS